MSKCSFARALAAAMAIALICSNASGAPPVESSAADSRASISASTIRGTVLDNSGQPLAHAAVLVYEARVKKGFSIFCPTCWVDCGKRASTDSDGSFTIPGVSPALKFTLLIAKEGFSVARVNKVDPSTGPVPATTLKVRSDIMDPSRVLHGHVVDSNGAGVPDALIEPRGVMFETPSGPAESYGLDGWSDALSVSSSKGDFEIAYDRPATRMTLRISARAKAPLLFVGPTGEPPRIAVVQDGVSVVGRVFEASGKPAADVELAIESYSRYAGSVFAPMRIGTRNDGSFSFTNVPARHVWVVYPTMKSLLSRGQAAAPIQIETSASGGTVDAGAIHLQRGHTLSGVVVVSDGKPIPSGTRAILGTEATSDNQMVEVTPNGAFSFEGLASGTYDVGVGIMGYEYATPTDGQVLVNRDRKRLVLTLIRQLF